MKEQIFKCTLKKKIIPKSVKLQLGMQKSQMWTKP